MTIAALCRRAPIHIDRLLTHTLMDNIGGFGLACDAGLEPVAWVICDTTGTGEAALNAFRPRRIGQLISPKGSRSICDDV